MTKDNENQDIKNKKNKRRKKGTFFKSFKIFLVLLLLIVIIAGGALGGIVISIIKDTPEIDPTKINSSLSQTSTIYDSNDKLIEKIDTGEYRTFVSLNKMPQHLQDAFIAIEDERFLEHNGVDPKGIAASLLENFQSRGIKRGASTITQQLVKNVYLTNEQTVTRKIKEAYLSLQVEKVLHKDQIMEAYLNRNFFGQNAAGVQEASQTYFSKDVGDLTLAESALFAGIVKSPVNYQPFLRIKPQDYDSNTQASIGEMNVLGEKYMLVFNEESIKRQKLVLQKMLELEKISQTQYDEALKEDIKTALKPGQKKLTDITSYFTDYVKTQVIDSLVEKLDYSAEDAEEALYKGGLKIYSTVDLNLQKELEDVYDNFTEVLVGNTNRFRGPVLIDWRLNNYGNIIDDKRNTIFYKKSNLLDEDFNLIINKNNFYISQNGDIVIDDNRLTPYSKHIDVADFYTIDERKNLVTHTVGSFDISETDFKVNENKEVIITKSFLDKNTDFSNIDDNGNLIISESYFYISKEGIVQPQSATVVLDYRSGQIKAIVGGRDVEGNRILNRATSSQRQPGSVIKPLAAYIPALDNGYTAATAIEDAPFRKENGELWKINGNLWPKNSYNGYKGMRTLRSAVEDSGNVPAVTTVQDVGIPTSISYLEKFGIINKKDGEKDNFVTATEDPNQNDENLSALGLGGMTNGLSPLEVTAAYGAIANDGVYKKPIAFTQVLDKDGLVLLENTPEETTVVSPQIAYIMADVLRTNVANGIARNAQLSTMVTAGKTGTTQNQADIWFVGFTPYYVTGVWIGNDSPKITLNQGSSTAASFWKYIMNKVHDGLESKYSFDRPNGIVSANICTQSGKLATNLCYQDLRGVVKNEIFAMGTVPSQYCDFHKINFFKPPEIEEDDNVDDNDEDDEEEESPINPGEDSPTPSPEEESNKPSKPNDNNKPAKPTKPSKPEDNEDTDEDEEVPNP